MKAREGEIEVREVNYIEVWKEMLLKAGEE